MDKIFEQKPHLIYTDNNKRLEKEMLAYSSILAGKIPWTEETGRLQSMGSQRTGHDLATKQQQFIPE